MKRKRQLLTEDDIRCFLFLWKWKLATTAAIRALVFSPRSMGRTYRRLLDLERRSFIQSVYSRSANAHIWTLNDAGYFIIKDNLPLLKAEGYRSENLTHDFWVTAIHLGPWMNQIPPNCGIATEQELRRIDFEFYPDWVPKTLSHRPDGWWKVAKGTEYRTVALEVELSLKSPNSYREVAQFYETKNNVSHILWFVKSKQAGVYIQRHLQSGSKSSQIKHSFFYLDHYGQLLGHAQIQFGHACGQNLFEVLDTLPVPDGSASAGVGLLDTRKKPVKAVTLGELKAFDAPLSRRYVWSAGE